jgi:DNA-binding transcriptional LysR family regulator
MADQSGLREFVAVIEHGSFTAAADALNVSTSFVSREVKRLEKRLNARLLHRTTRKSTLTEVGKIFYARGLEIRDMLDALESEVADMQGQLVGHIRITAPGLYADRYVAPAVAEFTDQYPEVSIELDTGMQVVDIIADGYDLAVRMSALEDSSLVARKVAPRRIMVCASPGYLIRNGRPKEPEELSSHRCLTFPDMPWRFLYPDGVRSLKVRGPWVSDNGRALVAAAERGLGLIHMTDYYMAAQLRRGELELVLEDYEVQDAATWLVYPARDQLPTRVRFLIDFLAERLKISEDLIEHVNRTSA